MSIAYWIYNYTPKWEAASKEVAMLHQYVSARQDSTIVSFNKLNRSNRFALMGPLKSIPIASLALCLPLIRRMASRFNINHIFASLGEPLLLRRMPPKSLILTVSKENIDLNYLTLSR